MATFITEIGEAKTETVAAIANQQKEKELKRLRAAAFESKVADTAFAKVQFADTTVRDFALQHCRCLLPRYPLCARGPAERLF